MAITALIGAASAAATFVFTTAGVGMALAVGFGAAAVFDYMMDSMAVDDASVDTMGNRVSTGKNANSSRKIVYGVCRVGGTIVYQATSSDNKYLHTYIVFCEGEVGKIVNIYFNDDIAWSWVYDESTSQYVGRYQGYYASPNSGGGVGKKTTIFHKTGSANQLAIFLHDTTGTDVPTDWDATSKLDGMCYAYVRLEHDPEVFPNGFPNITAWIQGKHIYDPRYDNTQSAWYQSGYENKGTYGNQGEYNNNAALVLLDYMMNEDYGLGESLDSFDPDTTVAAIEACEEEIRREDNNAYVSRQFTCNGVVDTKNSHKKNIQNILTAMNGQLLYSSGKFHIKPYVYQAPHSQIVTEDMLIGTFDVVTKQSRRDMFNRVKGKFNPASDNFKLTEYPVQISTVDANTGNPNFEDDDGETLYTTYDLPFTTKQETAQRLARLTLLRSRMQNTIKFTTNAKGLVYTVGDTIKVANETIGYSSADPKIYKIQRLQVMPDSQKGIAVKIEAKEDSQDIYDWDTNDLEDFDTGTTVAVNIGTVSPPTNLQVTARITEEITKADISWTASTTLGVIYEIEIIPTSYINFGGQPITLNTGTTGYTIHTQPIEYRIRVTAIRGGRRSDYVETTYTGAVFNVVAPTNIGAYRFNSTGQENGMMIYWTGAQQSDGASPYELLFKDYVIDVTYPRGVEPKQYVTTHNRVLISIPDISNDHADRTTLIRVRTRNKNNDLSSPLTFTIESPQKVVPAQKPQRVIEVYGTQASPTEAYLTQLVQESGERVLNETTVRYVELDGSNNAVDAKEFEFQTEQFNAVFTSDALLQEVDSDTNNLPEFVVNGTFDDTSAWTLPTNPQWEIDTTDNKLVMENASAGAGWIWQDIQTNIVGDHTVTLDIETLSGTVGVQIYENGDSIAQHFYTTTGTKTFDFTSQNRNVTIAIARSSSHTTFVAQIDNVSVKPKLRDAITEYTLYLPETVTQNVTFTHSEDDKVGVPATGVTETYTGFSANNNLTDKGRKYVKVSLARSATATGNSSLSTKVTATWTVATGGIGDTEKQAELDLLLNARVY